MKWFICAGLVMFSTTTFAGRQLLTIISSDVDKTTNHLSIDVDDVSKEITKMILQGRNASGAETSLREFDYDEVMRNGVVLLERDGRDIVTLKPSNVLFDFVSAGSMRVIYLYSGISNATREVKMNLVPSANPGSFRLTTADGKPTNRMFVKGNRALGQVIGIKEIQFSQQ